MRARARAPFAEGEDAGAVEAEGFDPGERVGAWRGALGSVELGEDPGGGLAVVLVVLDRRGLDLDAEAAEKVVEVRAVLLVLGFAEDDEAAACGDAALDGVDLGGLEDGRAGARRGFPARVGGVRDDEDVGGGEGGGVEEAGAVRGDVEVGAVECGGGHRERGVGRMGGLHLPRELEVDRPRLGVGLVEEDARDLGCVGMAIRLDGGDAGSMLFARYLCNYLTNGRDR